MSTDAILRDLRNAARRRQVAIVVLLALPWLAILGALAWHIGGGAWLMVALLPSVIAIALLARHRARAIDAAWLTSRLNDKRKDMDDSADLLFSDSSAMNTLERLQRARIEQRLAISPLPQLQPAWPRRTLWSSGACAALALIVIVFWPRSPASPAAGLHGTNSPVATAPALTRLAEQRLDIRPPAYTGLPTRSENVLDAKVPEGSRLNWSLRFAPMPAQATLVFHDGTRLPLTRTGEDWTASRVIGKATLYRLELRSAASLADQRLYRLDVEPDQAPQIRVLQPDRSLSLLEAGQREWPLVFEASDDYGLGAAQLHITLAQGSGENIQVKQRTLDLRGDGSATRKRYLRTLDLNALGLAAGDDLIVRLGVNDNRAPQAQNTRSASVILRWPPDTGSQTSGMEGLVKKTMPAYFRSQRQIIIDSEALLAERPRLAAERYLTRSDEIGVDQRILRLRYGQFLGEEADDKPSLGAEPGKHNDHDDDHDDKRGGENAEHAFGDATSVVEAFGHTHDHAEAATLLDPETRVLLKSALDQMWQSELHLRQGHPERALPFAYRALGFIKQVQQASRIYLARVGLELPPIDETRRLSGDRKGLRDRADSLAAASDADPVPAALWQSLETVRSSRSADHAPPDFDGFERWVRAHESSLPDALGLLAAIDAMRRDPDCLDCAKRLRALLWPLLQTPAAAAAPRAATDRAGQAYLDALQTGRTP